MWMSTAFSQQLFTYMCKYTEDCDFFMRVCGLRRLIFVSKYRTKMDSWLPVLAQGFSLSENQFYYGL